ncbi:hypothetical protein [Desulfolutivibrio sulfoxidireducens]|uniref:hypothetical protein n=1 Tax=Desulfolutivibrio sulfoxidireducens TaxID=2773299 RepID=UPI00159D4390|nr:hypothetical protein [Desulfolutivibrio sulfoxidireducens]QLA16489.1 hypothetical protein GD605_10340 [Desulfolutivibrio sulfoxidireducens]QLA19633.1 hypothetical protein GD604_07730 [Desulfolutivibrio sulfoxidireducens]
MDSIKATLPDMVKARVEDLYNAQLSDEEVLAHMVDMKAKAARLLELAVDEHRDEAADVLRELLELAQRVRRSYVDMAYRQGLRDGHDLKSLL